MRVLAVVAALALAGCGGVELITGDQNQVSFKSVRGVNPGPAATQHCAKFGKTAAFASMVPTNIWTDAIYSFNCVK